jgi:small subunit ribosomal protein S1
MVEEQEKQGGDPKVDEGWWESILSNQGQIETSEEQDLSTDIGLPTDEWIDWGRAKKVYGDDEVIQVKVFGFNQGGLLVHSDGLHGFVPVSHLSRILYEASFDDRRKIYKDYVSQTISVKIIECSPDAKRIVFSERAAMAGDGSRKRLVETLGPGDVITGKVTNITDFGVFIDLGGIEGLAHVSELSWGKVIHPKDLVKIGQEIHVLILTVNNINSRIALSLKRLQPNPWDQLLEKYRPGDRLSAVISSITRYGIFAKLEEGVEGLIHISVIDESLKLKDLRAKYKVGQQILVCILRIDAEQHRLGLSLVEDQ